jgi:DNA-binding NtrC family response regulator
MTKDIILVDDDKDILAILSHIFSDLGWEPYVARNATDAIELFKNINPPLVITDLRLGDGVGGVNVCKTIKEMAPLTLCVAMSGYFSEDYSVSHLRRCGFDHLMAKIITHEQCKLVSDAVIRCRTSWDELMR